MTPHRGLSQEVLAAIAYHEAGHAVAYTLAYRNAHLPDITPPPSVKYLSVLMQADNKASGICFGSQVYTRQYAVTYPHWRWRDAMEWQIVIDLAGGIAEAIHRGGAQPKRNVMWFASWNCSAEEDFAEAETVLADLRKAASRRYELQRFADRTLALLLAHWDAVEALALELIEHKHVDGARVEALVG